MKRISHFILKIDNFIEIKASEQILYFIYFLTKEINKKENIDSNDIKECFDILELHHYSNISGFLNINSKGKNKKIIKNGPSYKLSANIIKKIEKIIGKGYIHEPTDSLFPLEIFNDTRKYLLQIAKQATSCYEHNFFDASFILIRKLFEILIIEAFETNSIDNNIKNTHGDFLQLSDLITSLINEKSWNISKNNRKFLPILKKLADQSTHNRRFIAKKSDIDKHKIEIRILIEELTHLSKWK